METKGIEKAKKLGIALDKAVELGEKVMEDGKINMNDLIHAPQAAEIIGDIYDSVKEIKEIGEELKDIDLAEAVELLSAIFRKNS